MPDESEDNVNNEPAEVPFIAFSRGWTAVVLVLFLLSAVMLASAFYGLGRDTGFDSGLGLCG